MSILAVNFSGNEDTAPIPCKNSINTRMGEICIYSQNQDSIVSSYTGTYLRYIYDKFDAKKIPFPGRKYSNKRLYNVYRYIIHKDGTISDITPIILEKSEFDDYVKNLIINNPPAPLLDGMPDELKIELEVVQTTGEFGVGGSGYKWGEYYNIIFRKGKYFDD